MHTIAVVLVDLGISGIFGRDGDLDDCAMQLQRASAACEGRIARWALAGIFEASCVVQKRDES
ncbi:MAG TPA: hypothetical protein VNQ81_15720 [Povalibacter sp.]|nr:hypothetical protein [Povalibacter sp.]